MVSSAQDIAMATLHFEQVEEPTNLRDLQVKSLLMITETLETTDHSFIPKSISTGSMIKSDLSDFCCFFNKKYVQVRRDGLCIFRCALAIKNKDLSYAMQVKSEKIKVLALSLYSDLINSAIRHGLEASGLCDHFDLTTEDALPKLTNGLIALWNPQALLKLFSSFSKSTTSTNTFCCFNRFSQEHRNAAEIFCDVFCGHLVSNFAQPAMVKWGNHYLLKQEYFN